MNGKLKIEETAARLFAEKGYHGTSISMIAKEAGVAQGLLYMYYKSKEELLVGLIKDGLAEVMSNLFEPAPQLDANIEFKNFLLHYEKLLNHHSAFLKLLYALLYQDETKALIQERYQYYEKAQKERLQNMFMRMGKPKASLDASLLWYLLEGLTQKYVQGFPKGDTERLWYEIRFLFS